MKEIISWVYDPKKSIFKTPKNEPARGYYIQCSNTENCGLYKNKQCVMLHVFGGCPYGEKTGVKGLTQRSVNYNKWINDFKEKHNNTIDLDLRTPKELQYVGDYVFFTDTCIIDGNYARHNSLIIYGSFIKRSVFTCDFIVEKILGSMKFNPKDEEYKMKFMRNLSNLDPELYNRVMENEVAKKYEFKTNVGKYALLNTLNPNKGVFKDVYGGTWTYDGTYLISKDSHTTMTIASPSNILEVKIKPSPNLYVMICDDEQVKPNTVFSSSNSE